jgi:hypothetical protein
MTRREKALNQNEVAKLTDIGKFIKDGDSVAVGGAWLSSHPMALVRQIIRLGIITPGSCKDRSSTGHAACS